jgi:hypothetical protein
MAKEDALREALIAFVEDAKNQYIMLTSILAELDALRETVRGLDPTFADVLEQKRQESAERTAAVAQAVIALYDEKVRILKDGEVV